MRTALDSLHLEILEGHVKLRVRDAVSSGDANTATEKSEELLAAVQRFAMMR